MLNPIDSISYPSPGYPGTTNVKIQETTRDRVTSIVSDQLKLMPTVPDNIKMRVGGLIKSVNTDPGNKETKKNLFHLTTCHLYSTVVSPASQSNLVVMGMVMDDGVGDYHHILNAAESIKSKFPDTKISMLVFYMDEKLPQAIRKPIDPQIETIFFKWNQDLTDIYPMLQKADQIIDISQDSPSDKGIRDIIKQKGDKYKFIGEYGHWRAKAMGLKNDQLGIIIKDKPSTSSLLDLKNEALKKLLFGTSAPSKEDLENYFNTHETFVGYLKMGSYYQMGLIYTTAAFLKSSDKQTVDLMIPPVKMEYLDTQFLKEQGIGKIKVITLEEGKLIEKETVLAEKGKELRLINPFPLEQQDFHTLVAYTNPLVGCTGDHSWSEVISFDRLPFYEVRRMKIEFQKRIIKLAGFVGNDPHYLKQYLQELLNMYDPHQEKVISIIGLGDLTIESKSNEANKRALDYFKNKQPQIAASALRIANLLQQPELVDEYQEFNELLRTQYSFNSTLHTIVARQLALNSHPELLKAEKEIQENYLEDRITLIQANEQLTEKITNISVNELTT